MIAIIIFILLYYIRNKILVKSALSSKQSSIPRDYKNYANTFVLDSLFFLYKSENLWNKFRKIDISLTCFCIQINIQEIFIKNLNSQKTSSQKNVKIFRKENKKRELN